VLLFSSFTLVSRLGFSSSLTLPDLAALRFGIGGMLLLPALLRFGLSGVRWRDAGALALFGGLGFALSAYAGIALMAYDSLTGASVRQLAGDGFLLLASALWSAYGVLARRLGLAPAHGAAIVAVFSMCSFLPVYAMLPGKALFAAGARDLLLQALVQGALIGAVSIFVYTRAVATLGPAATALFTAAVPCVTTMAAMPLLGEFPDIAATIGVGAVTLGMTVAMRSR
jgi:drug/metabolite transporter (DMT)-like permease